MAPAERARRMSDPIEIEIDPVVPEQGDQIVGAVMKLAEQAGVSTEHLPQVLAYVLAKVCVASMPTDQMGQSVARGMGALVLGFASAMVQQKGLI